MTTRRAREGEGGFVMDRAIVLAIDRRKKNARSDRERLSPDHERDIATDMRLSRYESAIRRWVDALNHQGRGASARVEDAVHDDIVVLRFGFGANAGHLVEEIRGVARVAEWFGLTPAVVQFELAGPVVVEDEATSQVQIRYSLHADEFVGGGIWRLRIGDDSRIVWLEHRPDDIPDPVQEGTFRTGSKREHLHDHPHHADAHAASRPGKGAEHHH